MVVEFDRGPTAAFRDHFAKVPDYTPIRDSFWFDWGPIFYRGRLNGSARLVCIGSDPGPTERIANRVLIGDAGQRVQGFLAKLGLTHSYLCINAFAYALFPGDASHAPTFLARIEQAAWRNRLFDMAKGPNVQAVVAFGAVAQAAVDLWPGVGATPLLRVPHPSSHDEVALLAAWRDAIVTLRGVVTPDGDGDPTLPNYGATFQESDHAAVPRRDLPFGVPPFLGDDSALRASGGRTSVKRPNPDDHHTLIWIAPTTT